MALPPEAISQLSSEYLAKAKALEAALARPARRRLYQTQRRRSADCPKRIKEELSRIEKRAMSAPPVIARVTRSDQGVYVIGAPGHAVKIGIAADAYSRLKSIQTGCPERLRVYHFVEVDDARSVERECHRRLSDKRKSGEWFDLDWRDAVRVVREVVASR